MLFYTERTATFLTVSAVPNVPEYLPNYVAVNIIRFFKPKDLDKNNLTLVNL